MRARSLWRSRSTGWLASGRCRSGSSATPCLRRLAFKLAEQLGWAETYDAEYVALTQLQADALVTLDTELARRVEGIVPTETIEALRPA